MRYEYPHELCPAGTTPAEYLERLVWAGAAERYGGQSAQAGMCCRCRAAAVPANVRRQIADELRLISELKYEHYFLTVWDLVRFARIAAFCVRGAGRRRTRRCAIAWYHRRRSGRIDLLFERFISRERTSRPDIDVDFEHERREEVFQYIYNKYGRERAGLAAEVITYRPRSAVRDVGKALGLSLDRVAALAKALDWWSDEPVPAEALQAAGLHARDRTVQMVVRLVRQLLGFPRHLSQHVGGFVITETPLCELVPLENGAMPARTFIEWDKDDIDALGILKIDCLALGMLTALQKCFALLGDRAPTRPQTLAEIPPEDPRVYDMICRADTVGVFQIESRAQMSMVPRLRPRCFYDLVIEVAIVRPGPIQGGMVHPYLRRRHGEEPATYPSTAVRQVLEKTLGVPLFQEQVMRLAVVAAGFTPGEADQLRRAMAAWRRAAAWTSSSSSSCGGCWPTATRASLPPRFTGRFTASGNMAFPRVTRLRSPCWCTPRPWLKCYQPAAFCAALLNSQPLGFYTPAACPGRPPAWRQGTPDRRQLHAAGIAR